MSRVSTRALADLACEGQTKHPIEMFRLARFKQA